MIDDLIEMIAEELEADLGGPEVYLGGLDSQEELAFYEEEGGAMVVTLLHIERDGSYPIMTPGAEPPVYVNLYVLISAHFPYEEYREALEYIGRVLGFFQGNRNFSFNGDDLIVELANIDFREMGNIWNVLGARHKPYVLYKVRTLTIVEG